MKDLKDFSTQEVGYFLTAAGVGDKVNSFAENGVDGALLLSLTEEDFKNDLGLSGLQSKKVLNAIDFMKSGSGASSEQVAALQKEVADLKDENVKLQKELAALKQPKQAPAPAPAPKPKPKGAPVVRGAAGGAAKGAILGAVGGAIAGDAAKGAKIGAAVGATGGGMQGLAARRRIRRGLR